MHAAGERLADNIAEHEDAAGYWVSDFGIASKSEPARLPGLYRHAPHYRSQGRHFPGLPAAAVYDATTNVCLLMVVTTRPR
jgi:hypothetical protein